MKKTIYIAIAIIICFCTGFIGASFQKEAILEWYPSLNKSPLNPPNYTFGIVWSILYVMMGTSIGLIAASKDKSKNYLILLFIAQLLLNAIWSILFFYLRNPLFGMIDIVLLDLFIIIFAITAYRNHKLSSLLFIPYIIWVTFASYLNLYILLNN